MKSFIKTVQY